VLSVGDLRRAVPGTPCTSPEHRQFDFWLGEWYVTTDGEFDGANNVTSELDGCLVAEQWNDVGQIRGWSLNTFDRTTGLWYQHWVDERDHAAVPGRHTDRGRQVLRHGIVERHEAARHHVGEQRAREDLRDGPDLEHGVSVQRVVRRAGLAHRDDPRAAVVVDAHDDARVLPRQHPTREHRANLRVARELLGASGPNRHCGRQRDDGGGEAESSFESHIEQR
jgi:hypothetical protein